MKNIVLLIVSIFIFAFSCENDVTSNQHCISGKIVGQKCDVYALQLDQKILGATEWTKKDLVTGEIEATYPNVIGLINLPDEFRADDKIVFVTFREPTTDERNISCYTDMPPPPSPYYIVLSASETKCNETER
ncbi:MAG: hypothetical protein LW821_10930 [Flammeovirgaceae bacterium]|jgi:hypothetical protein|nr:hypothetical protein [Flammeovirgaceae bacterium]